MNKALAKIKGEKRKIADVVTLEEEESTETTEEPKRNEDSLSDSFVLDASTKENIEKTVELGGQRQFGGPQQMNNSEKIAYNVEHVFIENGREVRKMPVEINGETIWVECVPGGGQGVQGGGENRQQQVQQDQEGGIMMEIGDSDGLEIPGQGMHVSTPVPGQNSLYFRWS